ncbi:Na(+)/H(+) exchange regulatory cofactor NHE-RF3 [Aplochiton taeniatus]
MKYTTGVEDAMEFPRFMFNPKEGIDNPALVISDDPEPDQFPVPQLCRIKRVQGQSFGFCLRVERGVRGYVVRHVESWSPAQRSGLCDGDRVLEVNEEYVNNTELAKVVRRIQWCGQELVLLVLKEQEYEQAVSLGVDLQALCRAHRGEGCFRPRLCHVPRHPVQGLGLCVVPVEGQRGQFILTTASDCPAERAGVRSGDKLVWINGLMASTLTHSALMKMVKKGGDSLTLLVIDSLSEAMYLRRKMPILPTMAASHNLPHQPRTIHLVQGPDGYGFLLRQERLPSGRIAHLLREVDAGSPAEKADMQDGDLLLAVNGQPTESMEHDDIVKLVRKSGGRVSLTAIPPRGRDYYTQLGIFPLLFHEDDYQPQSEKVTVSQYIENQNGHPHQHEKGCLPCPRLCHLEREESGFGFHLGCVPDQPGTFIGQVVAEGSGKRAGLWEGDVVVEVNGQNVEQQYFEDVVVLIKKSASPLQLLVVERSGYDLLKQRGCPITAGLSLHSNKVSDKVKDAFL